LRSPALIATGSTAGCHAVLASLSGRYPPLEGRSPTRYSPVCHATYPLRDFRVRLACVRHAASVDSEPGSNSHVKFAATLRLARRSGLAQGKQLINASMKNGSALFNPIWSFVVRRQSPKARTATSDRPITRRHTLTLYIFSNARLRLANVFVRLGSRIIFVRLQTRVRVDGLCVLARTIQFSKNRLAPAIPELFVRTEPHDRAFAARGRCLFSFPPPGTCPEGHAA
jgi:hypothetical protein